MKARALHKHWESSVCSGQPRDDVAHKGQLRALAEHLRLLSQDGSHYTPGLYQTGSIDQPTANDVWTKVHPELRQFLAKLFTGLAFT